MGFNNNLYFSRAIPQEVRKVALEKSGHKCIWCGSTDRLEVDHKNGRYNNVSNNVNDFQILCKSCNDKKRERCKKCVLTGQRFNVQSSISNILFKSPFTCGDGKYNDMIGCKGCFLYDIEDFYTNHDNKKQVNKGKASAKVIKRIPAKILYDIEDFHTNHDSKRQVNKGKALAKVIKRIAS
jgi:predicted DNA-binding protein